MNIATFAKESALNRRAYDELREQIRRDYTGQYVVLAHGKVRGTAPTFDEAQALAAELEMAHEYYLIFPADEEPDFELAYDLAGNI
jgi:hypothetical protein